MEKLNLSTTTLVCADCRNIPHDGKFITTIDKSIKSLERCKAVCDFADVKLLTSLPTDYQHRVEIQDLPTLIDYSLFVLLKIHEYIDTPHMLLVQHDGWILNPQSWDPSWLNLDYIGPLFNQYDIMGVGGFSFRSRALAEAVSKEYPHWDGSAAETDRIQQMVANYEDGAIAIAQKDNMISKGFKYASLEQGSQFAQGGNPNNEYYVARPFGYHGSWRAIDQVTGIVDSRIKHDYFIPDPL